MTIVRMRLGLQDVLVLECADHGKMVGAKMLRENGREEAVLYHNSPSLADLQELVGGPIQIVRTLDGRYLVIDEEGKLKERGVNRKATSLYLFGDQDPVVGDALLCDQEMLE